MASRRGEIFALINSARSEADLGAVVASELCEAYEAEIGFVLVAGTASAELVGSVGLLGDDPESVLAQPLCWQALTSAVTTTADGTDLVGLGIRSLALAPRTAGGSRLLVGVGRLYEQAFEHVELALLEAVTKTAAQALERFGLERQLQRAHETEAVARMASGIAHEFSGALATIIELCDRGPDSPREGASAVAAQLSEIRAAAASAAELAHHVMAFGRQPTLRPPAREPVAVEPQPQAEPAAPLVGDLESLAQLFRRLGHPVRLRILLALAGGTLSPSELEQRLDVKLGLVAYHVRDLRDDGLVTLVDRRAARGSVESFYRLTERGELARGLVAAACRETGHSVERA